METPKVVLCDCCGTLVRWHEGLCETVATLLQRKVSRVPADGLLKTLQVGAADLIGT